MRCGIWSIFTEACVIYFRLNGRHGHVHLFRSNPQIYFPEISMGNPQSCLIDILSREDFCAGFFFISPTTWRFVYPYSIHVPGWLQKWLNLITAPGSVSNAPGSVTWLATKYLKTVSWINHTEKLTTWWPQIISFWPKINIPSSYFTILMLNCLENTLKLQFDSYVTAVRFLT